MVNKMTITELIVAFLRHAKTYYVHDGEPTGVAYQYEVASRYLMDMYSDRQVSHFTRLELYEVRDAMTENPKLSLDTINDRLNRIKTIFNAKENFQSTLMSDFLKKRETLSKEAKAVFNTGKALWKYYHETIQLDDKALVDASLYEIREYF